MNGALRVNVSVYIPLFTGITNVIPFESTFEQLLRAEYKLESIFGARFIESVEHALKLSIKWIEHMDEKCGLITNNFSIYTSFHFDSVQLICGGYWDRDRNLLIHLSAIRNAKSFLM